MKGFWCRATAAHRPPWTTRAGPGKPSATSPGGCAARPCRSCRWTTTAASSRSWRRALRAQEAGMANFLERLFGRGTANSANAAKERLQLVLIHDRTDISQAVMDQIKDEIIAVISKHVSIDRTGVDVNLSQMNRQN